MRVYRIEHVACSEFTLPSDPFYRHGPMTMCGSSRRSSGISPGFGGVGPLPGPLEEDEYCAVTAEQYPDWWDAHLYPVHPMRADRYESAGFAVVAYECPGNSPHWRVFGHQIIIKRHKLIRVGIVDWDLQEMRVA